MAHVALLSGNEVPARHTGCGGAVVTTVAGTENLRVIHPQYRYPRGIAMAILADIGGLDVAGMFASGRRAVVTTRTVAADAAVIEIGRHPAVGGVAQITGIVTRHMVGRLAGSGGTVVAAKARTDDGIVIDTQDRYPGRIAVTVLTYVTGLDMACMLTGGGTAVMATEAVCGDAGMIKVGRHPGIGGMTKIACIVTGDMGGVLAGGGSSVVTAETGANHIGMIDPQHGDPGRIAMAILTNVGGLDMAGVFACCRCAVVTARAIGGDAGMVKVRRHPAAGGVAGLTVVPALDM